MKLLKDVIDKIYQHALEEYPDECCGIVTGDRNNQTIHLCKNVQNRFHAENPEKYPRDARTAYMIERSEVEKIISSARKQGKGIIAFYHSHIDNEAFFSETDVEAQTVFGEPEFPDALHIVVSVMRGRIYDIKCFKWDKEIQNFTAVECCD